MEGPLAHSNGIALFEEQERLVCVNHWLWGASRMGRVDGSVCVVVAEIYSKQTCMCVLAPSRLAK
jgi:hypothetical protein